MQRQLIAPWNRFENRELYENLRHILEGLKARVHIGDQTSLTIQSGLDIVDVLEAREGE